MHIQYFPLCFNKSVDFFQLKLFFLFLQFIMGFESTYLWEDPIQSGVIFGSVFASLISICYYSLISVCAYGSLTALLAVLSLKVYTYVMVTFLKKEVPCNPLAKVAGKSTKTSNFPKYFKEKKSYVLACSWDGYTNHEFTNPENFSRKWMMIFTFKFIDSGFVKLSDELVVYRALRIQQPFSKLWIHNFH